MGIKPVLLIDTASIRHSGYLGLLFMLTGCAIPGGGTFYRPTIPGGQTASSPAIIAGHENRASRKVNGLEIDTRSWSVSESLRVEIGFAADLDKTLSADLARIYIETKGMDGEHAIRHLSPAVRVTSSRMKIEKHTTIVDPDAGYAIYIDLPEPAPENFTIVVPDLRLNEKQLGPLQIFYHRKKGLWLYLITF